jgi:hypothetical protein
MMATLRGLAVRGAERFGYSISRRALPPDMEPEFIEIYRQCAPYSMTSIERMYGLYSAVNHLIGQGIPGDFVECGVWQGGSAMLMARTLAKKAIERSIWLYDTFAGMTEPTDLDRDFAGQAAAQKWQSKQVDGGNQWCRAGLDAVRRNMASTGHPEDCVRYVEGPVEKTLLEVMPDQIALLRLDTDWYESTKIELELMYPKLVVGGVLIVDDYGHWQGARRAVDEYFNRADVKSPLLMRMDYTGRLAVRCA